MNDLFGMKLRFSLADPALDSVMLPVDTRALYDFYHGTLGFSPYYYSAL